MNNLTPPHAIWEVRRVYADGQTEPVQWDNEELSRKFVEWMDRDSQFRPAHVLGYEAVLVVPFRQCVYQVIAVERDNPTISVILETDSKAAADQRVEQFNADENPEGKRWPSRWARVRSVVPNAESPFTLTRLPPEDIYEVRVPHHDGTIHVEQWAPKHMAEAFQNQYNAHAAPAMRCEIELMIPAAPKHALQGPHYATSKEVAK